jgi:hypothetical protein
MTTLPISLIRGRTKALAFCTSSFIALIPVFIDIKIFLAHGQANTKICSSFSSFLNFPPVGSMLNFLMKHLEPPDTHFLLAATGWLELGNAEEARLELERISPEQKKHPDVLEVAFDVFAAALKWQECADAGRALTVVAPTRASGWIHLAFALHELKQTQQANAVLEAVAGRFARNWLMRYNLACYQCQLGNLDVAWQWLEGAVKIRGAGPIKGMAMGDRDLEPLREKIAGAWI